MPPTAGAHSASESDPAAARSDDAAPIHVAIIMDGNGRWAKARSLPRALGHRSGVNALKRTVEAASSCGVNRLTVFGFSTENWRRPVTEVTELMNLLKSYVESDLDRLAREGVQVRIIGRRTGLSADILEVIERAERRTISNQNFVLQVAFNYGGQADIADAARKLALAVKAGEIDPESIDEASFGRELAAAGGPPPDLIIRTSGEKRLSNFLLWEAAYAELVFQDVLWPDYGPAHLKAAVEEFRRRDRRYGGTGVDDVLASA